MGALPRGRSVCKLPLHLQPGPRTCLRCLGGDLLPRRPQLFGVFQSRAKLAEEPAWRGAPSSALSGFSLGAEGPGCGAARRQGRGASGTAHHEEQPRLMGS